MVRSIAAALGVVILLYGLVHAAPAAIDQEVDDPSNSTADDLALSVTQFSTAVGGWVPLIMGVILVIMLLVAAS